MSYDTSSALRLVTPPAAEPITLSQAKAFLRIEHSAEDATIAAAITAARMAAEEYLRLALLPQVWEYTLANPLSSILALPVGPAQSITSVTLTDEEGDSSTMDDSYYRLAVDGFSLRFTNVPIIAQMKVRYSASSYASVNDVPALLVQGMLHHIDVLIENRQGTATLPLQSLTCYQPFRRIAL